VLLNSVFRINLKIKCQVSNSVNSDKNYLDYRQGRPSKIIYTRKPKLVVRIYYYGFLALSCVYLVPKN